MRSDQIFLRESCRKVLMLRFPQADPVAIDKCCNEWVHKENRIVVGVVNYFRYYFLEQ